MALFSPNSCETGRKMRSPEQVKIHYILWIFGAILVAAYVWSWIGNRVSTKVDTYGRPVKSICRETAFGRVNSRGDVEATDGSKGRCSADLRHLSSKYVTSKGRVYWMTVNSYDSSPCISGRGDSLGFLYNLSWECLTATPGQVNSIEDRRLYLVALHSESFRTFEGSNSQKGDWQWNQLADYAADKAAVYYLNRKIEGADPRQFSVIFPFGDDDKWKRFAVSKSGDTTFVGGNAIGNVDLRQFRLLKPVRCPGHWFSHCIAEHTDDFFKYGNWGGIPGQIGGDIVFLQTGGINRFPGMASPEMFMFATTKGIFFFIRGKFYALLNDAPYPTDDPKYPKKNLVELDASQINPI